MTNLPDAELKPSLSECLTAKASALPSLTFFRLLLFYVECSVL
jgi:hypothetical protein